MYPCTFPFGLLLFRKKYAYVTENGSNPLVYIRSPQRMCM